MAQAGNTIAPRSGAHRGGCERLLAAVDDPVAFASAALSEGLTAQRPSDVGPSPAAGALLELHLAGCSCRLVHDEPDRLYTLLRRLLASGRRVQLLRLGSATGRTGTGKAAPAQLLGETAWSLRQLIERHPARLPVATVVEILLRAPG